MFSLVDPALWGAGWECVVLFCAEVKEAWNVPRLCCEDCLSRASPFLPAVARVVAGRLK